MIHLPGLFEEAEKNLQKGNGEYWQLKRPAGKMMVMKEVDSTDNT